MSRLVCLLSLASATLSVAFLSGCGQSANGVDPALLAKHRARLTLAEEPSGAQVVPEVRNALLGISDDHEDHDHADEGHEDHDGDHADHDHAEHDSDEEDSDTDHDAADEVAESHDENDADAEEHDGEDDDNEDSDHEEHAEHDHEEHEHAHHDEEHAHHDDDDHEGHDHEQAPVVKATEPMEVVLVGQIGGLTNPWKETQPDFPFARNQAAFFLADPQSVTENAESGHQHAPGEECAFCAAHEADRSSMLAMVRFLDENGDVLRIDVRDLFEVKETDTVVVQGTARVLEGGMMVVEATGLYVRR